MKKLDSILYTIILIVLFPITIAAYIALKKVSHDLTDLF